ncbi:MAG: TonB-dependent receptor [Gammaproteobacteria bacterium]
MNPHAFRLPAALLLAPVALPVVVLAGGVPTAPVKDEIVVIGKLDELTGTPQSASQGVVTAEQLELRPVLRTGEVLEVVPGLIVTQHSGDGKANQYFLRGFNLDHGTDLALSVDGVPVNMPTHGHGQGYADTSFVIPSLLESIAYRKGTYYAETGNFSAAGSVDMTYKTRLAAPVAELEVGAYDYQRALAAGSAGVGGGDLLGAIEYTTGDGPWDREQDLRRWNGLLRFGQATDGGSWGVSLQGYDGEWKSTDQIPQRAVDEGLIDEFGYIDGSDAGESHRYALVVNGDQELAGGVLNGTAYAVDYKMQLFSNFSYFTDPVNGDQFEQFDDRNVYGGEMAWSRPLELAGLPNTLKLGSEVRFDDINTVGLYRTIERERFATTREDTVEQVSYSLYASIDTSWNSVIRTVLGVRGDRFDFDVDSNVPENSGSADDSIVSPKASLIVTPWVHTEFFANYGRGFHSNDARGTTITVDPTDGVTPVEPVDPLVDATGVDLGFRTAVISRTQFSASFWTLDLDSELLFIGDAGLTEPNRASERRGVELSALYRPLDWIIADVDYAWSHARFKGDDPGGDRIPGAVENVGSIGLVADHPSGWSGGARLRYLSEAPLIEDNSTRSGSTTVVNLEGGFRFSPRLKLQVSLLNAFDSGDYDITYFYESQLPGESAPVEDIHFHPVEPRQVRVAVTGTF